MSNKTQLQTNNTRLSSLIETLRGKATGGSGGSAETWVMYSFVNVPTTTTYVWEVNGTNELYGQFTHIMVGYNDESKTEFGVYLSLGGVVFDPVYDADEGAWEYYEFRTLTFTGGVDLANPDFKAWLQNNGEKLGGSSGGGASVETCTITIRKGTGMSGPPDPDAPDPFLSILYTSDNASAMPYALNDMQNCTINVAKGSILTCLDFASGISGWHVTDGDEDDVVEHIKLAGYVLDYNGYGHLYVLTIHGDVTIAFD